MRKHPNTNEDLGAAFAELRGDLAEIKSLLRAHATSAPGETLNTTEAADYLGIAKQTLFNWLSEGRLPHYKVGRAVLFKRADLDEYLESCRRPADNEIRRNAGM